MKKLVFLALILLSFVVQAQSPYVLILGITQDGGLPHAGCEKNCCKQAWNDPALLKPVSCIAIIDPSTRKSWIIDATPDFGIQLRMLRRHMNDSTHLPSAIFLTHAHIGHYSGLMELGKEVMSVHNIPVYAMPRMHKYLITNGPWSQLVKLENIRLLEMHPNAAEHCNDSIQLTPFLVPHRDEFSETVGFSIKAGQKKYIYIPDIDKWEKFYPEKTSAKLDSLFSAHTYALIDGTFYSPDELGGRNILEIPHPTVVESMNLFSEFSSRVKKGIYFIHFNHTNPVLKNGVERETVIKNGFHLAETGFRLF